MMKEITRNDVILNVKDLVLSYENHLVLNKVSFQLKKGEFVYLVGKTGSGKSSFLRCLYADFKFQSGLIHFDNLKIESIVKKKIPFLRRKLGIIFQDFELLYDRNVTNNLLFVLKATGWKEKRKILSRIQHILIQVGLTAKAKQYPNELSGGEKQRLAIARSLLNDPLLLIADEPTGNLDPEVADEIHQLFTKINASGTAVIMATHNFQLINKYPYRTIICKEQSLVESNTSSADNDVK